MTGVLSWIAFAALISDVRLQQWEHFKHKDFSSSSPAYCLSMVYQNLQHIMDYARYGLIVSATHFSMSHARYRANHHPPCHFSTNENL